MRNEKQKIRINDIFYNIIKEKRLIILLTLLGLLLGVFLSALGYIRGEMTKQYKITTAVAVSAQVENGYFSSKSKTPNKDDFGLSKDMTDTAMFVISGDNTLSEVVNKLDVPGISAKSIKSNLSLTQYNTTQIIEISLTWRSESEGINILQTLTEVSDNTLINTLSIGKLSVVNPPSASYIFGGNIKITTLVYSVVLGFLAGILICVIKLLVSPKLLVPEDMERMFGVEVLGTVPFNQKYGNTGPLMILPEQVNTEIVSTANILLNRLERAKVNRIYVTSATRKEGKTRLIADLAVRIAETGKRVLIIDCDFTNPTMASLFGINKPEYSLNDVYNGDCDSSDAILKLSGCLDLLPSVLDSSAELTGDTMMDLLDRITAGYDYVLIDVDSVGVNSEVIRFNKVVQAALFVVKFDYTELADIRKSLMQLSKSGLPVAGCIVNGSKTWREVWRDLDHLMKKQKRKKKNKEKDK